MREGAKQKDCWDRKKEGARERARASEGESRRARTCGVEGGGVGAVAGDDEEVGRQPLEELPLRVAQHHLVHLLLPRGPQPLPHTRPTRVSAVMAARSARSRCGFKLWVVCKVCETRMLVLPAQS
eukprot:3652647-Rhodomonas_salina.1